MRWQDSALAPVRLGGAVWAFVLLSIAGSARAAPEAEPVSIPSLESLSIPALRARAYRSAIAPAGVIAGAGDTARACIGRYHSDGLELYARIEVPGTPPPPSGYPVVAFVHGWVGAEAAPAYDFGTGPNSVTTGRAIRGFAEAGFLVVAPGLRGHGTLGGVPADGIEFLTAWDNGSYLSPMFYAIDVLNLLAGLETLAGADFADCGREGGVTLDLDRVYLTGHSQGGDVALAVLAVTGEGSTAAPAVAAGSIWAGTFAPRIVQAAVFEAMQTAPQAFLSGDGRWTGSARGADGSINPDFVFAYPPDWIGSVDPDTWTWQRERWSRPSVAAAVSAKHGEMYRTINRHVADIVDARFELDTDAAGRTVVHHDPRVRAGLERIGGFGFPEYLSEPLALHHSDRDFYSLPEWNAELCARINAAGGRCLDFVYPGATHGFGASAHAWFAPGPVVPAFDHVLRRDVALFSDRDPAAIPYP